MPYFVSCVSESTRENHRNVTVNLNNVNAIETHDSYYDRSKNIYVECPCIEFTFNDQNTVWYYKYKGDRDMQFFQISNIKTGG